jgi:D-glycero-D-manno-heptose 1,7-bisphosphate phosphatase
VKQKHGGILSDNDGTIDTEIDCVRKSEELDNIPNSIDAIREANASRAGVFVTANQSGIARGFLTDDDLSAGREHLVDLLEMLHAPWMQVTFASITRSSEGPPSNLACHCRKPDKGMLKEAETEFNFQLAHDDKRRAH